MWKDEEIWPGFANYGERLIMDMSCRVEISVLKNLFNSTWTFLIKKLRIFIPNMIRLENGLHDTICITCLLKESYHVVLGLMFSRHVEGLYDD